MRPIWLAIAVAGAVETMGAGAAHAQCSVFSRHPCVPDVCSVFSRHPCVPELLYPYGEDLRLTIVSTAPDQPTDGPATSSGTTSGVDVPAGTPEGERRLDTIRDTGLLGAAAAGRSASRHADVGAAELQAQRPDDWGAANHLCEPGRAAGGERPLP